MLVLCVACSPPGGSTGGTTGVDTADPDATVDAAADPEAYARELFRSTNEARAADGLAALAQDDCAADEAGRRAADLVGRPLEHAPLDPVITACSPAAGSAAENLSRASAPAPDVVDAWLGSPGHRANVLDATMTAVGIACVPDPSEADDALVCSQVFLG